jgi:excisionase family DNA binding protein
MNETTTLPKLIEGKDVAGGLNIPLWRVYALVSEGSLPHVRIGRRIMFDPRKVAKWVDEGGTAV